jgi:hypothetical protein
MVRTLADLETDIPEERHQLLHRRARLRSSPGHQHQEIDVG